MNQRHGFWSSVITLGPILFSLLTGVGAAMSRNHPLIFLLAPLALLGAGLSFFLRAKLSVISQGAWISFGSARMSPTNQRYYQAGYALMLVSVGLALGVISAPGS